MYKRMIPLAVLALVAGFAWSQETNQQSGPVLSGEFVAGFVDGNLLGDPFVAEIPGLSGILSSDLELRLSSLAYRAAVDRSIYKGVLTEARQLGYELGVSLDLADLLDLGTTSSEISDSNADDSNYPLIQRMLDWYANNFTRYGLPAKTWPTTSYGTVVGGYQFIYGDTAEPIEWVNWDQIVWSNAKALYTDLRDTILQAIEDITLGVTTASGEHVNQYSFLTLTPAEQEKVLAEQEAYDSFMAFVYGSDESLEVNGVKIRSAWLAFTNIFGILDARFDYKGTTLSTGALVRSPRASQPASGSTFKLAMAPGIVSGLSLSMTASVAGGVSSEAEDWNTKSMQAYPGESAWLGAKISAGYDLAFLVGADVKLGLDLLLPDLTERLDAASASFTARYSLAGPLSVNANVEFDALLWNDRNIEADPAVFAMAFGGRLRADYLGLGISAKAAFKQLGFGGVGGNDLDDRFGGQGLWTDFDAAKVGNALAVDGAIVAAPAAILGMDLGSLSIGYRVLVYGIDTLALQGSGWYADLGLEMYDLLGLPLSLDLSAGTWTNPGLVSYQDAGTWPVPGLLTDLTWNAAVSWQPSEKLTVSVEAAGSDSGYKRDTYGIVTLGAYARIAF